MKPIRYAGTDACQCRLCKRIREQKGDAIFFLFIIAIIVAMGVTSLVYAQQVVSLSNPPATAPSSQPSTLGSTALTTGNPQTSPLDRAPAIVPPVTAVQSQAFVGPCDLSTVANRAANVHYDCAPDETYTLSGPINAANVTIDGHGSRLQLSHLAASKSDVQVLAAHFTLCGFSVIGDGGLAFRVDAPGATFTDCTVTKVNSFLWIDPPGIGCTVIRPIQGDRCGGQWIYSFADSTSIIDPQLPYGSSAEEPIRFSPPDATYPGYLAPVGCLVSGGFIIQPAGKQNLQKSALAIRGGRVAVRDMYIHGAISGGQIAGTDTAVVNVSNCTFDADPIYPSISMQRGVRLAVDHNRFRGGNQPASIDYNSSITSATGNTIELPSGKKLIDLPGPNSSDGTGTVRVPPVASPTTQPGIFLPPFAPPVPQSQPTK